ncbi:MAG: hypothetical protein AB8H80_13785 [Planctomycetota bacterium]
MNQLTTSLFAAASLCALSGHALAQSPNFLLTFSQQELSTSGSGGTVLAKMLPNEINYVEYNSVCATSAEKWLPRTASHVMLGDEDGDGVYFRPNTFGPIDAVMTTATFVSPALPDNQRTVYWSVSQPIGSNVSATPFRPGDVARVRRIGGSEGQVQHFMRQEQFNQALGLPPSYPIDIDAVAFQPNFGVFFSVDVDVPATTVCGPTAIRDGDVLCIPGGALTYTPDLRVAAVAPMSAVQVFSEAQMNVFTNNAQVSDRFGACVTTADDIEALEMDLFGPSINITPCPGFTIPVPNLIYSCETGTGASLLQTAGAGSIWSTPCGLAGTPCGGGPTFGPQMGVRPMTVGAGVESHINGLARARVCRHVLEPQQHVMPLGGLGAPFGANAIDYYHPFVISLVLIEIVPPVVPFSVPAAPFSPTCFPDLYTPSITSWMPVPTGYGSFPMPAIPVSWSGKVMFQGVGFGAGTFELSTPAVIDVL